VTATDAPGGTGRASRTTCLPPSNRPAGLGSATAYAVVGLGLLALFTAVSMTILTNGLGAALARMPLERAVPVLGVVGLAFGVWYALGALEYAPYFF
jgi:hypothetical protein